MEQLTERVERLRTEAEEGVEQLRREVESTRGWWTQYAQDVAEAIATRRERYRRERERIAERSAKQPHDRPPTSPS